MYTDKIVTNSEFEIPQDLEGEQVLEYVKPLVLGAWKAAKDNIFAVGRWLNAAKQRCDHGEFGAFIKAELPFSQSTAEKLMAIANSEVLNEPEVYEKLPASWGTLSSLAGLAAKNPFDVRAAAADGRIKDTMTKAEVEALKKASDTPAAAPSRTAFEETHSGAGLVLLTEGKKYGTIYIDPPWAYMENPGNPISTGYPTMNQTELLEMADTIKNLSAETAHMHMWCTASTVPDALALLEAYGFEYKSQLVWVKDQGVSLGHYWRNEHEILLLGVKGNLMFNKVDDRIPSSVFNASRTDHSRKPGGIRELIKAVSPGPHIELFSREQVPGWTVWGNEVEEMQIAA